MRLLWGWEAALRGGSDHTGQAWMCLNYRTAGIQMPFLLGLFPSELRCFQNTWTRTITLGAETACLHLILQMKCREYPHPSKPVGCLSVSSAPVLTGHSDIPRLSFTGFLSWQEEQLYKAFLLSGFHEVFSVCRVSSCRRLSIHQTERVSSGKGSISAAAGAL